MPSCPHCHHELPPEFQVVKTWKHLFNHTLLDALRKFARGVGRKGRNDIHTLNDLKGDLALTYAERANLTTLRFFGLVAKVKQMDGTHRRGHWLLTRRGSQFLKGKLAIPRHVLTLDNKVIGHAEETITLRDMGGLPSADLSFEIIDQDVYVPLERQVQLAI